MVPKARRTQRHEGRAMSKTPIQPTGDRAPSATATTTDREIIHTRVFEAPAEAVYRAWTSPEHVHLWWGPRGFTTTMLEMSVRQGGVWRFVMHGPDGTDYPNRITFTEVVPNARLAFDHGDDEQPEMFKTVVEFAGAGDGRTRLTMRTTFPTPEALEAVKKFGAVEGGQQTLDRLDEYLPTATGKALVVTRTFDAPLERVWRAHTELDSLKRWWGPSAMELTQASLDLRPGGRFHYCIRGQDGAEMWGRFV
jgi:uncharacterized protein YndB with AHSA1/START domain